MFDKLSRMIRGDGPAWIDVPTLQAMLDAGAVPLVIDVRQPEEFLTGHVPGAENTPLSSFDAASLAARDMPVVVVCQTARRSVRAAALLAEAGAKDVSILRGGTSSWIELGLPVA